MHHAPPEVLDGQRPTRAGDVYSLGSTLFELIGGRPAFEDDSDDGSMVPMLRRILTDPPPDLRMLGVPDAIASVIERSMAKDPVARQSSAEELGRELQSARRSVGLESGKLTVPSAPIEAAAEAMSFVAAPSQVLCPVCHSELVPGAAACASCGTPVGGAPAPPAGYQAPAATTPGGGKKWLVPALVGVVLLMALAVGAVFALRGGDEVAEGSDPTTTSSTSEGSSTTAGSMTTTTADGPPTTLKADYTVEVEQGFITSCVEGGSNRNLCRCIFTSIREQIPYDRYIDIVVEIGRGAELSDTELQPLVLACIESENANPSGPS
jgi:hypothetical protein